MSKSKSSKDGGDISATVEESNEMRKKLGIKPLEEGKSKTTTVLHDAPKPDKSEDPKKKAAAARNRKEHEELTKGKGLGDILADEEGKGGAAEWIAKTRSADGSMKKVGTVAKESGKKRKESGGDQKVPNMKVRHDQSDLKDGEEITMTLADKPILNADGDVDEDGDELANPLMLDREKAKLHEEIRNQTEYDPTKDKDILEKYNDIKTGPKGFMLGGMMGVIEETDPEKRLAILTQMSEKQSLESKSKLQADYYTLEEMSKFKKAPKKKMKKRKVMDAKNKEDMVPVASAEALAMAAKPADAGSDEEDPELYEQLSKQRRLVRRSDAGAVHKGEAALSAVSDRIGQIGDKEEGAENEKSAAQSSKAKDIGGENVSMTATTEFCNVVQTPLEKMDTLKHESFRGSTLYKQQVSARQGIKAGESRREKKGLGMPEEHAVSSRQEEEVAPLDEDGLDMSIASGLVYLRARSQIGGDQESHRNRKLDNRPLEMSTVDGDIKLEYRDDYGRVQTPKEAFRSISWKFHGKMPGRKNMERRLLRLENEMKLKGMNPVESLPTLRALRQVQHTDAKPYMALSGANEK